MPRRAFWMMLAAFGTGLLANEFVLGSTAVGLALLPAYVIGYGVWLGRRAFPGEPPVLAASAGTLLWLAILAVVGGCTYRLANLAPTTVLVLLAVTPIGIALGCSIAEFGPTVQRERGSPPATAPSIPQGNRRRRLTGLALLLAALTLTAIAAGTLAGARTGEALRSPWVVVPQLFFAMVFLANLAGLAAAMIAGSADQRKVSFSILLVLTGLGLAAVPVVYGVGYGFDPFIHQATSALIKASGSVSPKPWYYLGQYGLVVALATLGHLNVATVDTWLLPLAAAVALPTILLMAGKNFSAARGTTDDSANGWAVAMTAASLLALPLGWFTSTTPQGVGNLTLLAIIFAAFGGEWTARRRGLCWILSAVALVTHPLAGVPAVILLTLIELRARTRSWAALAVAGLLLAAVIPVLFSLPSALSAPAAENSMTALAQTTDPAAHAWLTWPQRYQFVLDTVYAYGFNLAPIAIVLAIVGAYVWYRRQRAASLVPYLAAAAIVAIDGLIINRFLPPPALIAYERMAYGDRLLELALFFLLPLAATALLTFWQRLRRAPAPTMLLAVVGLATLRTAGAYLTAPRFDSYAYDRGYSTSVHDLAAVRWIDGHATGPYLVLADQAVSAAALRAFGFKSYFTARDGSGTSVFYYPIPTGGPLYQYYLKMVYQEPAAATVREAMDLVGVREAYFVLNDYWADADRLIPKAKAGAAAWTQIDGGRVYIFEYRE